MGTFFALLLLLILGTVIGGFILRAAIALYNKAATGRYPPRVVPEPPIGRAMVIMFVASLAKGTVDLIIGFIMSGAEASARDGSANITIRLVSVSISLLVTAGMLSVMLPTSFGRAIVVALFHFLILLVIVGILTVIPSPGTSMNKGVR